MADHAPNALHAHVNVGSDFLALWVSESSAAVNGLLRHCPQPGVLEGAEQGRMALALEFLV